MSMNVKRILPRLVALAVVASAAPVQGQQTAATTASNVSAGTAAPEAHGSDPEAALVAAGAYVARTADCVACHTAPGGKPFAGGLALKSGIGTIWSTNITPDRAEGIGTYTEAQFAAALRDGLRSDGAHLYPAMPYTAYRKLTDGDVRALYVYIMRGVEPVASTPPRTSLVFPFSQRWGMAFWNWAFAGEASFRSDPNASAEINRGAYLVEGPGHCGTCHTPRGLAMQEKAYDARSDAFLGGSVLDGWPVPSMRGPTAATKGFAYWSVAETVDYLGNGRNAHAAVGGEMTSVVAHSLSHLTDADLKAIAVYLKSIARPPTASAGPMRGTARDPGPVASLGTGWGDAHGPAAATANRLRSARELTRGERIYLDNCGACHFVTGQGAARVFPALDGASVVNADDPDGLIRTILGGASTPSTRRSPSVLPMPGFAARLSDDDIAELATFLRGAWTNKAKTVSPGQVASERARPEAR